MGDDNRHEMMESLFGAESGGSDDEPDKKPSYSNDSNATNSGRDDEEEGEGEGGGEVDMESDLDGAESERAGSDGGRDVESEADRGGASDRDEASDREVEEAEPDVESEAERGGASDKDEASDREIEEVEASVSGSETSHRGGAAEYDDHEVDLAREPSEQGDDELGDEAENEQVDDEQGENEHDEDEQGEDEQIDDEHIEDELGEDDQGDEQVDEELNEDEQQVSGGVAVARDVFGDTDEDDEEVGRLRSQSREVTPLASPERVHSEEDRSDQEGEQQNELVEYEGHYDSDDDRHRKREKPVGPPLDIEVPLKPPPSRADQLNLVRVSNIMGIESKPFDPKTFEEESTFVTDAEGRKQRIRLEGNVARWRIARNRDGSTNCESNARFVKWSDGSMQLLLGNEVLDLSVQDSRHDQSHLFIRHPKSILQSQGRLLHKMKFMPSSLTSKSHKLLTALVDSRNKRVLKVKSVVTNIDPDKEKEGQEKAVEQRIRSKSDLQRKQEKISRKFGHMPSSDRDTQLSSGYLEASLEEEEEGDDYDRGGRRQMDPRRFQQQLDAERGAERRIMNAKRQPPPLRRPPVKDRRPAPSRREVLEDEEEAYETDPDDDGDEMDEMDDEDRAFIDDPEEEEPKRYSDKGRVKDRGEQRRQIDRDDEDRKRRRDMSAELELSPPKKSTQRRRVVVSESDDDE